MLTLNKISLIRTTSYYNSNTIKSFVIESLKSPFKSLIQQPHTEFFLKDISFTISKGERVALLGKNGSGKSTVCRLIAEQLFASSGKIENSFTVNLFSQIESSFFKELSGFENLKYFIKFIYRNSSSTQQQEMLKEACDFSELGLALNRQVETYSTGMLSRLSLSLILAQKHDLLILDEMQAHADAAFREKVSNKLTSIIKESNTVIVVSHHAEEALASCTRGIVLDSGKVAYDGSVEKALAIYHMLSKNGSYV